ncbi:MAG TPA: DUF2600 family protein [Solirubrobacteraceae bacterium]
MSLGRYATVGGFTTAAWRYWTGVFPCVCGELAAWSRRAAAMPDPVLRSLALEAHGKRGNMEGAAAFAAFAPKKGRKTAARAAVAFQAAYNYLDILAEQPSEDPIANGRALHEALLVCLQPDGPQASYYEHADREEDADYLKAMVECCRTALRRLPSGSLAAQAAIAGAKRVIAFQSFNLGELSGDHERLASWGEAETPVGSGLYWWETAAAGGSSLGVHVLIAAATEPDLSAADATALEQAYFPWIGALHSLLDNVIDVSEDARTGQRSLVSYYASSEEAASRMRMLAERSKALAAELPNGGGHVLVLAGMTGLYLSAPEASVPEMQTVRREVLAAVGELARPTLLVFAVRRCFGVVNTWVRRRGRGAGEIRIGSLSRARRRSRSVLESLSQTVDATTPAGQALDAAAPEPELPGQANEPPEQSGLHGQSEPTGQPQSPGQLVGA